MQRAVISMSELLNYVEFNYGRTTVCVQYNIHTSFNVLYKII